MESSRIGRVDGSCVSWFWRVVAGVVLAASAGAQGNVIVLTDAHLDLRIYGDGQGNRLLCLDEYELGFTIRGLDGTTVNGEADFRPSFGGSRIFFDMRGGDDYVRFGKFEEGGCCGFEIDFRGGQGNDTLRIGDEKASLSGGVVDLGPGADLFQAAEDGGMRDIDLACGEGNDVVRGTYTALRGAIRIDLGRGDDLVDFYGPFTSIGGSVEIEGGPGTDTVVLEQSFIRGSLLIAGGDGDDLVEIAQIDNGAGGPLAIDGGSGADRIQLSGDIAVVSGITLKAGDGADRVRIDGARTPYTLDLTLGTGDDELRVEGSSFEALVQVVFDGAEGVDRYTDFGGNHFAVPPAIVRFEGPRAARLVPAPLVVATALAGRVVDPGGAPVADAMISVAELGLTTSSGADGGFRLDGLSIPFTRLELTAAATVRGRRMATRVAVRPTADATTELGAVVVEPTRALTLLFGDDPYSGPFAERLRGLMDDPFDLVVERFLPQDLTPFEVVWHVGRTAPLVIDEQLRLAGFVLSGGGLHLSSEFAATLDSQLFLLNALLTDPDVDVAGSASSPIAFNPDAVGALTRWPNVLVTPYGFGVGSRLAHVEPENVFVAQGSERALAAAWASRDILGGRGRITLGLSNSWLSNPFNGPLVENLLTFLRWEPDVYVVR
jgi:hypothetical protein